MRYRTFFMLAALIILAAIAYYIVCPKYFWDSRRSYRFNRITGTADHLSGGYADQPYQWQRIGDPEKNPFDDIIPNK